MTKTHQTFAIVVILALFTFATSCATKSETGAATGAVAGGVVGAAVGGNTAGLLIGSALGGLFGYGVGRSIEHEDQRRMALALERNQPVTWTNPDTGVVYVLQPTRTYFQSGQPCRRFHLEGDYARQQRGYFGTACRQPNGSWQVVGSLSRAP